MCYILASSPRGTLYIGVTGGLVNRISLHREHVISGFTRRYHVDRLVWFQHFEDMPSAINREKQLKKWARTWKIQLIEERNSDWRDLWADIV
jgi:putative endonuclease